MRQFGCIVSMDEEHEPLPLRSIYEKIRCHGLIAGLFRHLPQAGLLRHICPLRRFFQHGRTGFPIMLKANIIRGIIAKAQKVNEWWNELGLNCG